MISRINFLQTIIFAALFCLGVQSAGAQSHVVDSLVCRGDSLRISYDFESSISAYNEALAELGDSLATAEDTILRNGINDRLLLSENGRNMAQFAYTPKVVASHRFSKSDFFLYYPLRDSSWRATPNQLDSLAGVFAKAVYVPSDARTIYFSSPDQDGIRNIYTSTLNDTLWTLPALLNEALTSASDEIYPMLSEDGKSLYFASEGLFGVGGYDIYHSKWDEEAGDWSEPVNMGFPYSSPYNDFLLVESEDGKHVLFASDRECSEDSVTIYVLEKESVPVRSSITDPSKLRELSNLLPATGLANNNIDVKSDIPENVDIRRYLDKMAHVRALRDSLAYHEQSVTQLREQYSLVTVAEEMQKLADQILNAEAFLPELQERLDVAVKQLQDIEMDFLFSGVVIDPDKMLAEAEREIVGEATGYVFSKKTMGLPLVLEIEKPEEEFDYTFKIVEEPQILREAVSDKGIVYQIQILSADRPVKPKALKGLSPVFETISPTRRYVYRVGLFHEYKDVLPHLNTVKRLGFRTAYIVGMVDGVEKSVAAVRNSENERKNTKPKYYKVVLQLSDELSSAELADLRARAGEKDMAKVDSSLIIGPFNQKEQADALIDFVEAMGYGQAILEVINN